MERGTCSTSEQRLQDDFGLTRLETTWLTAWNLAGAKDREDHTQETLSGTGQRKEK